MHIHRKFWFNFSLGVTPFLKFRKLAKMKVTTGFLSDCPSLMLGIAIHCLQHSQAMLERGVCELAHSFFHCVCWFISLLIFITHMFCLSGGFRPTWEFFTDLWDVTITGVVLQIFTYNQHSWPLSSEGSLTCQTYCDTRHPFIMVISENPWHAHLLLSVWQWSYHYLFLRLRSVAAAVL